MRAAKPWFGGPVPAGGAARARFEAWLEAAGPGRLLAAVESREWRDTELETLHLPNRAGKVVANRVRMLYRLDRAGAARCRARAIELIVAAGGRVELGAVVATVERGELRISMA